MDLICNEEQGSRAFWDEDISDDENYQHDEAFHWVLDNGKILPEYIDTLLIIDGHIGKHFAKSYLPRSKERYGYVEGCDVNLYRLPDTNTYICIAGNYNKCFAGSIVETLQSFILKANNIIGITFMNEAELVKINEDDFTSGTCVKSLSTDYSLPENVLCDIATLEAPNIIDGIVAGVISLRQFFSKTASAYACFTNLMSTDSANVEPVLELLKELNIPLLPYENNFLTPFYA